MQAVSQFVRGHMDIVFFVYGLSFFIFGVSVLFQVRKGSEFRIGKYLWLLAAFGMLHGVNEWTDLFLMSQVGHWTQAGVEVVETLQYVIGKISYVLLFMFGVSLPCDRKGKPWLPNVFLGMYLILITGFFIQGIFADFSNEWAVFSDVIIRYALAFPGALLTAVLFFSERKNPEIQRLEKPSVLRGLTGLGFAFSAYAFFVGLVVKPASFFPASVLNYTTFTDFTGLPVQFFRAICASSAVFFISKVLNIFEYETLHKLDDAYREIIRISNREQMRIGQDLHDDLGQQLTGIAFMIRAMKTHLHTRSIEKADEVLDQVQDLLDRSIDTTRSLSRGLCPVSIEKEGIEIALEELAENTEKIFGVTCSLEMESELDVGGNEPAVQIFRIAQEAVSNAVKHSGAKKIGIGLKKEGRTVTLSVLDDGSGIPPGESGSAGMGLKIMRYRAGVLGGRLVVEKRNEGGTAVACSFEESEK